MPPFDPVSTLDDACALDHAEVMAGYDAGQLGEPEPGGDRSRGYWYGWTCARADRRGERLPSQQALAAELCKAMRRE